MAVTNAVRTACTALCVMATRLALAHHGVAAYELTQFITFEGTVREYKWGNPHIFLSVDAVDAAGRKYVQGIDAASAAQLLSQGVTRDLLHAGEHVTIRANPNRDGPGRTVLGYELIKADGSRYPLTSTALKALGPAEGIATSIAGTWIPQPEGFFALQRAMRDWPSTAAAKKMMATSAAALAANRLKCIPQGAPSLMAMSVPIAIAANSQTVSVNIDYGDDTQRIVYLGATHPAAVKPTLLGHSVGHWDGATLIVDTVGFDAHPDGLGNGFPSSAAKHTVERFSLSADHKHLDYEITVEDPNYLVAAVSFRDQWDYRPEQKASNARCDAESAHRYLEGK